MITEIAVMITGNIALEAIGSSCEVDPSASRRLDKKYIIKIINKEYIIVLVNLSFCFKFLTIDDARSAKDDMKRGRKTRS